MSKEVRKYSQHSSHRGVWRIASSIAVLAIVVALVPAAFAEGLPTITTDQLDYAPGATVTLTGTDWQPGEAVHIFVNDDIGQTWNHNSNPDPVADTAGSFTYSFQLPTTFVAFYSVTATGAVSGTATTTFTDAVLPAGNVQLTNWTTTGGQANSWITGTLNTTNSDYKEGEVVPFRVEMGSQVGSSLNPVYAPVCRDYFTTQSGSNAYGYTQLLPLNTSRSADPGGTISDTFGAFNGVGIDILDVYDPLAQSGTFEGNTFDCGSTQRLVIVKFNITGSGDKYLLFGGYLSKPGDTNPNVTFGHSSSNFPGGSLQVRLASPDKTAGINPGAIIQLAKITVTKVVDSGSATPDQWCFTVTGPNSYNTTQCVPSGQSSVDFVALNSGSYTVTESNVPGYAFVSGNGTNCTFNGSTATATVAAAAGGATNASCTFHNAIQKGTLTVIKHVINDEGGTATADQWSIHVKSGANEVSGSPQPGSESGSSYTLPVGTYTVSETGGPSGYAFTGFSGDCDSSGNVTVVAGQTKTCTLTNNDQTAHLKLVKTVTNDNGGSAVATDWTLSAAGPTPLSGAGGAESDVKAGTYTLSETSLPGYTAGAWSCTGGTFTAPDKIALALGESATCTINNDDNQAYVIVKKVVVNDNGGKAAPDDFKLTLGGNATTSGTKIPVNPGTYTAGETQLPGYTFLGFSDDCNTKGEVTVALGETKTCTLTNDDKPGTIVIVKRAKPQNGTFTFDTTGTTAGPGTVWPSQFTLSGDPTGGANTKSFTLDAGKYTVKESMQLGWVLVAIGGSQDPNKPTDCLVTGSGGSTGTSDLADRTASIDLKNGDTVTCYFDNTGVGATRTQGFWATHPQIAIAAWNGGPWPTSPVNFPGVAAIVGDTAICGRDITTIISPLGKNQLMGGFWSDIAKKSDGKKRTALDQARMQLLQQLVAAELNASAFGSLPSGGVATINSWETALCSTDTTAIKNAQQGAASFNSSGDSALFTPGIAADSKYARSLADISFWDIIKP
jgi:Prealbumin-like fold domain